jgi:hypothetical protein
MHGVSNVLQSDFELLLGVDSDDDEEIELQDDASEVGHLDQVEVIEVYYIN